MNDRIVSYLRTGVPVAWGWLLTQLLVHVPATPDYVIDALSTDAAVTAVTGGVTVLWHVIWRLLETRLPAWMIRLALGSAKSPSYSAGPPATRMRHWSDRR